MGKSPGKWFKAVLFGKKSSKSNLSKAKEITKSAIQKTTPPPNKEPVACLPVDPPVISEPLPCPPAVGKQDPDYDKVDNARLQSTGSNLSLQKQEEEALSAIDLNQTEDSQRMMLEQATIKAQAAFRGFLARRAFRTLQGIIRLQAIIRGCLVRRQAVATLYCVHGIVKLQALVRGHMVRGSDVGIEVRLKSNQEKQDVKHALQSSETTTYDTAQNLSRNAFVGKLLSMSPSVMPLSLQYGTEEPNSVWNWLLRWTASRVWGRSSGPMKEIHLKHQRFLSGEARSKYSGKRAQSASLGNGMNHSTSDSEKTKRKPRRGLDHSANSTQGHPNEIEKVKRSLKKVSQSTKDNPVQAEIESEQPRQNRRKSHKLPGSELLDNRTETRSDKLAIEMDAAAIKSTDGETFAELPTTDDPGNDLHDHPVVSESDKQLKDDQTGSDKNEDIHSVDQTGKLKQVRANQTGNENHKISKRRASLPAKHDDLETGLSSVKKVPSYMAATESAKAKVRGQVSPRFGQDGYENNGLMRRHSLPSSTNAKLSSSPRVQRLIQASGRGGIKIDRSLSSSRDDKSIQEWRR